MATVSQTRPFELTDPETYALNQSGLLSGAQREALTESWLNLPQPPGARSWIATLKALPLQAIFGVLGVFLCIAGLAFAQVYQVVTAVLLALGSSLCLCVMIWKLVENTASPALSGKPELRAGYARLLWAQNRYVFQLDDGRQLYALNEFTLPLPGEYAIWYIPDVGLVVSAEVLTVAPALTPQEAVQSVYCDVFGFTAEDLEENVAGRISARQKEKVRSLMVGNLALASLVLIPILMVLPYYVLSIPLIVIGILAFFMSTRQLSFDLMDGMVLVAGGFATRSVIQNDRFLKFGISIEGLTFEVGQEGFEALRENRLHCVYYTPRSKRLLSIVLME